MAAGSKGGFAYAGSDTNNKTDCLGRIPYATLIALALTVTGTAVFCTLNYRAVNTTLSQMKSVFSADVGWLDKVQLTFILVAVIMGVVSLILLIVGALATGATRTQIYSGWKARLGGRISCAMFLVLTYILYALWCAVLAFTSVMCAFYLLFDAKCDSIQQSPSIASQSAPSFSPTSCVNFDLLSPILKSRFESHDDDPHHSSLSVCGSTLAQFCVFSDQAGPGYYVSFFACAIVMYGLIHFMICLAANYVHIKDGFKYFELEEIRINEENDMTHYGTRGTGNFRM